MNKYAIAQSSLTNNIYVGRLNEKRTEWLDKEDATLETVSAVVNHILQNIEDENNNTVNISRGDKIYSLTLTVETKKENQRI